MAVTKTLLKVVAEQGVDPGEILEKVNNDLARDNESCMFVTIFLTILDISNGEVFYSSAGHNPPLLITANEAFFVESLNEPIAGVMPGMKYTTRYMQLVHGDILFLYTDGVTEAMNVNRELYSDKRLHALIQTVAVDDPADIIKAVNASIIEFVGDAEQSDDITMLALKYTGGKSE